LVVGSFILTDPQGMSGSSIRRPTYVTALQSYVIALQLMPYSMTTISASLNISFDRCNCFYCL